MSWDRTSQGRYPPAQSSAARAPLPPPRDPPVYPTGPAAQRQPPTRPSSLAGPSSRYGAQEPQYASQPAGASWDRRRASPPRQQLPLDPSAADPGWDTFRRGPPPDPPRQPAPSAQTVFHDPRNRREPPPFALQAGQGGSDFLPGSARSTPAQLDRWGRPYPTSPVAADPPSRTWNTAPDAQEAGARYPPASAPAQPERYVRGQNQWNGAGAGAEGARFAPPSGPSGWNGGAERERERSATSGAAYGPSGGNGLAAPRQPAAGPSSYVRAAPPAEAASVSSRDAEPSRGRTTSRDRRVNASRSVLGLSSSVNLSPRS